MTAALITASVLMGVISCLCYQLSRAHLAASCHCSCIAEMLRHPDNAEQIAYESVRSMRAEGLYSKEDG